MTPALRTQVVENAIREMSTRYVFPDIAMKVAVALGDKLRAKAYDGIDDPVLFAERLTADLRDVTHDLHVRVRYSAEPLPPPGADDETPSPEQIAANRRRTTSASNASSACRSTWATSTCAVSTTSTSRRRRSLRR